MRHVHSRGTYIPKPTPTSGKAFNQETCCFTDRKKECDLVQALVSVVSGYVLEGHEISRSGSGGNETGQVPCVVQQEVVACGREAVGFSDCRGR